MSTQLLRLRGKFAQEQGFTVLELLIVMAILGVVLALAAVGLTNLTGATRAAEEKAFADTRLRESVEALARDIRAANPIDVQSPVSLYDNQITFKVFCSPAGAGTCSASSLRQITYRLTANRLEVSRGGGAFVTLLGPAETGSLPVAARQFALVNSSSQPVFTYIRADGTPLPTGGVSPAPAERFRDCTKAVRIHLRMITEPGNVQAPADLETTVTLRNFNEVSGCL